MAIKPIGSVLKEHRERENNRGLKPIDSILSEHRERELQTAVDSLSPELRESYYRSPLRPSAENLIQSQFPNQTPRQSSLDSLPQEARDSLRLSNTMTPERVIAANPFKTTNQFPKISTNEPLTADSLRTRAENLPNLLNRPVQSTPIPDDAPESFKNLLRVDNLLQQEGFEAPNFTPRELNRMKRDSQDPNNPFLKFIKDHTVDAFAEGLDYLRYETAPGKFLDRTGQSAGRVSGVNTGETATTGSKIADTTADIVGTIGGLFVNPANLQQGLVQTSYSLPFTQMAAARVGSKIKNPIANRVATEATREAIAGGMYGATSSVLRGETSPEEIAKNTVIDATLGGTLGGVIGGAGGIFSKIRNRGADNLTQRQQATEPVSMPEPNRPSTTTPDEAVNINARQTADNVPEGIKPLNETPLNVMSNEAAEQTKQNWFNRLFGDGGVGISPFGSKKRLSSDPLTTADQIVSSPLKSTVEGSRDKIREYARAAYQNFVDVNNPLKRISMDTYEKSIDAARANNIANTIIDDKFVTPQGEVVGESLKGIFTKLGRGETKEFLDYIVLRHAATRMARGERVYAENLKMTPEKVQQRINLLDQRYPNFKNIAGEWDKFNENLLRVYGVEEGLISPELFNLLREQNPNYAPMRRQFRTNEKLSHPARRFGKQTFSGQNAPIKEVSKTGSVRNIVDPRRSTVEATAAWVNAAMRNRVMQSIVRKINENPEAMKDIAEIVQPMKGQKNLREILTKEGAEGLLEMLDDDFNKLFAKTRLDDDKIVRAMVQGEPVYLKVKDPEAVKALIGMGAEQSNLIMDIAGVMSNLTKRGATGALAPMFAVKAVSMDVVQGLIQSKAPVHYLWDMFHAFWSSLADKLPANTPGVQSLRALAQDFRRTGGGYSAALRGERGVRRGVSRMTRYPLADPRTIARGVGNVVAAPFRAMEGLADISENLSRMAAYKGAMRRQGGSRTPEDIMKAINESRDITVNFSRKGSQSQMIEKFVPYQNAAVQGLYRMAKAFKDNPIKTTGMVVGAVIMPKMYEYAMFHDDPDYQKLPARERYRNLIIRKNEDGTFVKVPMPPEYNAIGALFTDTLTYYKDNEPDVFKGVLDAASDALLPPLVSGAGQGLTQGGGVEQSLAGLANATVAAPFVATIANQSFTGAPIVPQRLEGLSPEYQYDERTSEPAKAIGKILNMSPKKVDYLIRAYGGDPARLLLPLLSDVGAGTARNTMLRNFIVDPVFTNTLADDFYTAKEHITQAYNDYTKMGVQPPEWFNQSVYRLVTSRAKGSPSERLSKLSEQIRKVSGDESLSAKDKSQKLRELRAKQNEIYLDVNTKLSEAGVPLSGR